MQTLHISRQELPPRGGVLDRMLDSLFGFKFPYMMCMYNEPVNGEDVSALFHFHIANFFFILFLRSNKLC